MPNLLLHVGPPKTGTSAIQECLHANRINLLKQGYLYPNTGLWADHSHHQIGFSILGRKTYGQTTIRSFESLLASLHKEITMHPHIHTVIISSEILSNVVWRKDKEALKALLNSFETTNLLYSVRRQDILLESLYKQQIKDTVAQKTETPKIYFERSKNWFSFRRIFNGWSKIISEKNFHFTVYANRSAQNNVNNLIDEITKITGHPLKIQTSSKTINTSLNGEGVELKWAINKRGFSEDRNYSFLKFLFDTVDCDHPIQIFLPWQREAILDIHFQGNIWMTKMFPDKPWRHFWNIAPRGRLFTEPKPHRLSAVLSAFEDQE